MSRPQRLSRWRQDRLIRLGSQTRSAQSTVGGLSHNKSGQGPGVPGKGSGVSGHLLLGQQEVKPGARGKGEDSWSCLEQGPASVARGTGQGPSPGGVC